MSKTKAKKNARPVILVLDDSDLIIDLVTFAFRNNNVSIIGTPRGQEALRILEQQPINLIITDLKMPGMSGLEFLGKVRLSPVFGKIPILALSGYEEQSYKDQAKEAGANAYLTKPFTPQKLQAAARALLAKGTQ